MSDNRWHQLGLVWTDLLERSRQHYQTPALHFAL